MVKLIAHILVHSGGDYLLIQRSEIKRRNPTFIQLTGIFLVAGVEKGELPRDGALRECIEEAGVRLDKQFAQTSSMKIVNWIPLRIRFLLA